MKLYALTTAATESPALTKLYVSRKQLLQLYPKAKVLTLEVFAIDKLTTIAAIATDRDEPDVIYYDGSELAVDDYLILSISRREPVLERVTGIGVYHYGPTTLQRVNNGKPVFQRLTETLRPYADSYYEMMKHRSVTEGIKKLFNDYHSPCEGQWFGRLFHPNRHHSAIARQIEIDMDGKELIELRNYLLRIRKQLLDNGANRAGAFMRRIEFALIRLDCSFHMAPMAAVSTSSPR